MELGSKNPKRVSVPRANHLARISVCDTILFFRKHGNQTRCLIMGLVKKIAKGKEFDILYLVSGGSQLLPVIVKSLPARKQIATCKINQWCQILADGISYIEDKRFKSIYYAVALQGWYVPKVMDIYEDDSEPMNETEYAEGKDFLSQFEED
ncbi:MAG: hypothetical protein GXY57_01705 [Erysipelotrichaceae bacterium]|nr:hypothetical protein [Erysipelotrichaceae bacterium]